MGDLYSHSNKRNWKRGPKRGLKEIDENRGIELEMGWLV